MTFEAILRALGPVEIWRLADPSTSVFSGLLGIQGGSWVKGTPVTGTTTLVDNDEDGFATVLRGDCRGVIPHHEGFITPSGGVLLVGVLRDTTARQSLLHRVEGEATDGRMLVEHTGAGQITAKMRAGGVTIPLSSPTGAVQKGIPFGVVFSWGAGGLRLYVNSDTPVSTSPSTQGAAGERPISLGMSHVEANPAFMALGWVAWFSSQPSDDAVSALMQNVKSSAVVWSGELEVELDTNTTVTDLDVLSGAIFAGDRASAVVEINPPGSLVEYSVDANKNLSAKAGLIAGIDTSAKYIINGGPPSTIKATVTINIPFFKRTDPNYILRSEDRPLLLLPNEDHDRLSEGIDNFIGHPALVHTIKKGRPVEQMAIRVPLTEAEAEVWLMRWRFALSAGYNRDVQPDDSEDHSNGAKTIGFADKKGADGGDAPSTQRGYGCRVLVARGPNGTDWTFRPYSYHFNRKTKISPNTGKGFGQTFSVPNEVIPGRWYEVALQCVKNTDNKANGHLRFWVDGKLLVERTNIKWFPFKTGNNGSPGTSPKFLHMTNMFGGKPERQKPRANGQWYYRDFQLWTTSRDKAANYLEA